MLKTYETIFVTKDQVDEETLNSIKTKVDKIIKDSGGLMSELDDWGTRDLAYKIAKQSKGKYYYFSFTSHPESIKDIDFFFKINESVLTSMTIKVFDTQNLEDVRKPNVKNIR